MRIGKANLKLDAPVVFSTGTVWLIAGFCFVWVVWQCWGIEIMRPPWEDETDFTLPAVNWIQGLGFRIPQWTGLNGSEEIWRWHMPLFPYGIALWQKLFGTSLLSIRLFTLIPAALTMVLAALLCQRAAGQKSIGWMFFWLLLFSTDKTVVTNALIGRMESHALLFTLAAFSVALIWSHKRMPFLAGLLLGIACGFHPFALYFWPALAALLWWKNPKDESRIARQFWALVGLSIPCMAYAAWFLGAWSFTKIQFLTSVRVSSSTLSRSLHDLIGGFRYCYRMQPVLEVVGLLCLGVIAIQCFLKTFKENTAWPRYVFVLAFVGYIGFLLRGSANHYYYYTTLSCLLYLAVALVMHCAHQSRNFFRRIAVCGAALLLLNNLAFGMAKTYVIWDNRDLSDSRPMEKFLADHIHQGEKAVVPPNLWLYASQYRHNYRLLFTPIVALDESAVATYHRRLFEWDPDVVVLDKATLPPIRPSISEEELKARGYVKVTEWNRVFRHRYEYTGYQLMFYRRNTTITNNVGVTSDLK